MTTTTPHISPLPSLTATLQTLPTSPFTFLTPQHTFPHLPHILPHIYISSPPHTLPYTFSTLTPHTLPSLPPHTHNFFPIPSSTRACSVNYERVKVRLHVRSCDREVCLFYYVQIAIGDFYYAQLCAKLCVCARAIRSALRRNRSKSDGTSARPTGTTILT